MSAKRVRQPFPQAAATNESGIMKLIRELLLSEQSSMLIIVKLRLKNSQENMNKLLLALKFSYYHVVSTIYEVLEVILKYKEKI